MRRAIIFGSSALLVLVLLYFWGGPAYGWFVRSFRAPAALEGVTATALSSEHADEQRRELVRAWRAGESAALRRVQRTVEGDPIEIFLIVSSGRATLVTDYTRDPWGPRGYAVQHPTDLSLGGPQDADPLRAWFPAGSVYVLCRLEDGRIEYF